MKFSEILKKPARGGFGPTIEILCNAVCPRACPACNQASFMGSFPDYEYTPDDAYALIGALENNGVKIGLVFSGGEPSHWSRLWDVLTLFAGSDSVTSLRVTTSDDNEDYITRLKTKTDRIYFSHRPDHSWSRENPPAYMRGVNIWSAEEHVAWPRMRWSGPTCCCCQNVGIIAAVIGRAVYPCVVARNMSERGRWPDLEGIPVNDYFSDAVEAPEIGTFEACRWCVNNQLYRDCNPLKLSTRKPEKWIFE